MGLSEVLLNLLIATGFSGAITITLSHSTLHWLLRGMSVSCVMTEVNESQYFVFYFHNLHYKRLTSSWIHESTNIHAQPGFFTSKNFSKHNTKQKSFIKFTSIAFNTEHKIHGINMFICIHKLAIIHMCLSKQITYADVMCKAIRECVCVCTQSQFFSTFI